MKTSGILAVVAGAAFAAAQLDQIPPCALTCAISSLGATGCAQTDIACICSASTFLVGINTCIQGTCNPQQIGQTLKAAQVLCAQAGVTITIPGGPETTTAPPTSTVLPPPETTTAPEPETTTAAPEPEPTTTEEEPEPTTTEAPAETTTEVTPPTYGTTSDVVTLTTTTTICPSSTHVAPTYVPPPAQNTTVVVPPPSYTGAAGSIAANAGTVIVGAALAMFFA